MLNPSTHADSSMLAIATPGYNASGATFRACVEGKKGHWQWGNRVVKTSASVKRGCNVAISRESVQQCVFKRVRERRLGTASLSRRDAVRGSQQDRDTKLVMRGNMRWAREDRQCVYVVRMYVRAHVCVCVRVCVYVCMCACVCMNVRWVCLCTV
jgi:hypothetical protein